MEHRDDHNLPEATLSPKATETEQARAQKAPRPSSSHSDGDASDGWLEKPGLFDYLMVLGSMTGWARIKIWAPCVFLAFLSPIYFGAGFLFLPSGMFFGVGAALVVAIAVPAVAWWTVWHRRMAWRDSLPFELAKYPAVHSWKAFAWMTMIIDFEDKPEDVTFLSDVLGRAIYPTKMEPDLTEHYGMPVIEVEKKGASKTDLSRPWLDLWIRDTVDRLLVPLHREHPIRRLIVGSA